MRAKRDHFIKRLTAVTIVVLVGIVALQAYWLITSYRQQQSRFKADIQNALAAANFKTTVQKMMADQSGILSAFDLSGLGRHLDQAGFFGRRGTDAPLTVALNDSAVKIVDSLRAAELFKQALDTNREEVLKNGIVAKVTVEIDDSDLVDYKAVYKKELEARAIFTPFELAIVDEAGNTRMSTTDTNLFKKIPVKSTPENISAASGWAGLQAGFPNANVYLLRQMAWTLAVTILLLLAGCFSLGYLLTTFFRQRRLAELRADFMNNMTHELKTPISSVSVALEMVLNEQLALTEEKKTTYLLAAQKESNRLKFLVENVLQILSLEKGQVELHPERFPILPLLHEIHHQTSAMLGQKNAVLEMNASPEDLAVYADHIHLHGVLQNLVENALKYNDKSEPVIRIAARLDSGETIISVKDNGAGIPAKYLDNVFDKFFRVPKGNRHDVRGYGLGLSYVKTIVEMHGGSVRASSVVGEGSEFTFTLPNPQTA